MSLDAQKKILPCLDIRRGSVVVGQQFKDVKEVADPLTLAKKYSAEGADELVLYDITASIEGRQIFADLVRSIQESIDIPLLVGGGISTLQDIEDCLAMGANRVSINSGALRNPDLLAQGVKEFGGETIVLSIDVRPVDGRYCVFSAGGQVNTGIEALEWAKNAEAVGVSQLVLNSIATDGEKSGFDIQLLTDFAKVVSLPLVASGGAGTMEDFAEVFRAVPSVDSGLAASVFHFEEIAIPALKQYLNDERISVAL